MRIAIGGMAHDTNTFTTLPARVEDFQRVVGAELTAASHGQGLLRQGHHLVPPFTAHTTPSGKVARQAFASLLNELLAGASKACLVSLKITNLRDDTGYYLEAV